MTAGEGIAHAEQTPKQNSGQLSGVQLWVALPDAVRNGAPDFQHVTETPTVTLHGGMAQVFAGTLAGVVSPSIHHTPIAGADLRVHPGERLSFDVDAGFEHAALLLEGDAESEGTPLAPHVLYYFGTGRTEVAFSSPKGARLLFIGGPPFPETILMWWNFVARTTGEIQKAREDWEGHRRFGKVSGYTGARIEAPELMRLVGP
jgi:redox-sensitive bicupin YhaK (pirin superfamily)